MRNSLLIGLIAVVILVSACSLNSSTGDKVSVTITAAEGGSVPSLDGNLSLEIPPGALDADTDISISSARLDDLPESLRQLADPAMIYKLQPDGLSFNQPLTVTMDIPSSDFPAPDSEEGIPVYALLTQDLSGDPESLQELEITVSITEGKGSISAKLEHFSFVVGKKLNMKVRLEDLDALNVGDFHLNTSYVINTAAQGGDQIIDIKGNYLTSGPITIEGPVLFFPFCNPGGDTFDLAYLRCVDPGIGKYTLHVTAKIHTPGLGTDEDTSVSLALDADVNCVVSTATPTPTFFETPTPVKVGLLDRGIQLYNAGDLGEALIAFANVLEDDPENKEAYYNIGVIRIDLGEYALALQAFRAAIAIDPTYDLAHYGRALVGTHVGDDLEVQLSSWVSFLAHHPQGDELRTYANQQVISLQAAIEAQNDVSTDGDGEEAGVQGSFAHTQPGVQSEVYVDFVGEHGATVQASLSGPGVIGSSERTGTISESGSLRLTWTIDHFGNYTANGLVGEQSFNVTIQVE